MVYFVEQFLPSGNVICPTCLSPCNMSYDDEGIHCIAVTLKGTLSYLYLNLFCKTLAP